MPIDPALLPAGESPFRNRLLVAMPSLGQDRFFKKSVVYICAHGDAGAMGIILNQQMPDVHFAELLAQLNITTPEPYSDRVGSYAAPVVHFGGPVETARGFVLHSDDFMRHDTLRLEGNLCLTATVEILHALSERRGPQKSLFALGYAGWDPGQLEAEVQDNAWLVMDADEDLLFGLDLDHKWERALARLGITPALLSAEAGHA